MIQLAQAALTPATFVDGITKQLGHENATKLLEAYGITREMDHSLFLTPAMRWLGDILFDGKHIYLAQAGTWENADWKQPPPICWQGIWQSPQARRRTATFSTSEVHFQANHCISSLITGWTFTLYSKHSNTATHIRD